MADGSTREEATGARTQLSPQTPDRGLGCMKYTRYQCTPTKTLIGEDGTLGMVMIDPGSDTNFIKHEFARKLGLVGAPCNFRLKVVDREARPIDTARYQVLVEDRAGAKHVVDALGLETITILPPDPDLSPIQGLVQHLPEAVLQRPQGDVDMLLGLRDSALHGTTVQQWGNLRLTEGSDRMRMVAERHPPGPPTRAPAAESFVVRHCLYATPSKTSQSRRPPTCSTCKV